MVHADVDAVALLLPDPISHFAQVYSAWKSTGQVAQVPNLALIRGNVGFPRGHSTGAVTSVLLVAQHLGIVDLLFQCVPARYNEFVTPFEDVLGVHLPDPFLVPGYNTP